MVAKNELPIITGYRKLIDFLVKTKGFRGYSTLDYVKEKIRAFDPDFFKEEDEYVAYMASRKEEV